MNPAPTDRVIMEIHRLLSKRERKQKASVSISGELIAAADAIAGKSQRSALVERALRSYLKRIVRRYRNESDLAAINSRAATTNRESDWLLEVQAWPE